MRLKRKGKQFALGILLTILVLALLPLDSHGYFVVNYSECAFQDQCQESASSGGSAASFNSMDGGATIGMLVVQGAGYLLNGYSDILSLLNKVEMSELYGVDYGKMQKNIDNAIINIELARDTYTRLIALAGAIPYAEAFVMKLLDFDYDTFRETSRLNPGIFEEVKSYLSVGDIRGIYSAKLTKIESILDKLYPAADAILMGGAPPITGLWAINQECSSAVMFGQYASQVCYNIK